MTAPVIEVMPERLWHYTSGAGAKGIFQSRTLWAGHLGYMNDTSEVGHAMNLGRDIVFRLSKELPHYEVSLQKWIDYVSDNPPKSWAPNVFAVSFSEERDLLSQWRGYATGAGGPFCLGFPSKMLRERTMGTGWELRKCIYSREEQTQVIEQRIRSALSVRDVPGSPRDGATRADVEWRRIFGAVTAVAPLMKHPDFAEEREWRLVFGPTPLKTVRAVHFVERRHTLAPYIEFDLTEGDATLDDIHWIAGPGPQQDRANSALGMVAQIEEMGGYQGSPSKTPYLP